MTESDFGRVLGALLRAFDEIRAASGSTNTDDEASPGATDVRGGVQHAGPRPRSLEYEIIELLEDGVWRTAAEIAEKSRGGIRARRGDVEACLLRNRGHIFASTNGRELGRSPKATLYQLAQSEATGAVLPPEAAGASPSLHNGREEHGTRSGEYGRIEHRLPDQCLTTVELRMPSIKLLIGNDDR